MILEILNKMSVKCQLDEGKSLCLKSALEAFHEGIKEEQAWALIFQCCKSIEDQVNNNNTIIIKPLDSIDQLYIKQDGNIHEKSWFKRSDDSTSSSSSITSIISSIGEIVYSALDYGMNVDEERALASQLENLINLMINENDNRSDEGIVGDEAVVNDDEGHDCLTEVIEHCLKHAYDHANPIEHYRNVCRAMVSEALQLSTFLHQVTIGTKELNLEAEVSEQLNSLQLHVWASVWMSVMNELRHGVKLKSIDTDLSSRNRREYELTPFEMLLDDINSKRYTLKKVQLPKKVQKDAQEVILDFIRSRPVLRPATQRKLRPASMIEPSLHERLMVELKSEHHLKPTPPTQRKFNSIYYPERRVSDKRKSFDDHAMEIKSNANFINKNLGILERFSFLNLSSRRVSKVPRIPEIVIGEEAKCVENKRKRFSIFGIRIW